MAHVKDVDAFLKFVDATGSPFHTVKELEARLVAAGYKLLDDREVWRTERGGKYYVTRNGSSIAAFRVGSKFFATVEDQGGFVIAAAHTDSPCLRMRPNSATSSEGCVQLGVDTYGGGLWHTWFDRGLGICGKVVVKTAEGEQEERLIHVTEPICIIPNLAIHLCNAEERAAFKVNAETALRPVLHLIEESSTNGADGEVPPSAAKEKETTASRGRSQMPSAMAELIASEAGCSPQDIVDVDLYLMDATPARRCGIKKEFVESARLDNLVSCWASFEALIDCQATSCDERNVQVACAFDHEEVGSQSFTGADSTILENWLKRITFGVDGAIPRKIEMVEFLAALARSYLLSIDQAHAVHPNYAAKHQPEHKPKINAGVVIKSNVNQRYSTHAASAAVCRKMAARKDVPIQDFVVRNDSGCGSTIGPMTSARLGMTAVDLGVTQWAMHSCRELCGAKDLTHLKNLVESFFEAFYVAPPMAGMK